MMESQNVLTAKTRLSLKNRIVDLKAMRILVISDLYPPFYIGGYELRCKETVDEIARRGHDVFVLTSWWGLDKAQQDENVYRILDLNPTSNIMTGERSFDFLRFRRRLDQLRWSFQCRKNYQRTLRLVNYIKPDVVYLWNLDHVGINPVLAAQDQGIPTVYNLGAYWLLSLKNELYAEHNLLKRKYRGMITGLKDFNSLDISHLITNSHLLKKSYIEHGFPKQSITVIPRGVPTDLILENSEGKVVRRNVKNKLLFVGRLTPDKAPDVAIRSVRFLVDKYGMNDIKLDIIGTGKKEYINELNELVATTGLKQNIKFWGRLEHRKLVNLYSSYDALLFPSRWAEPFGVTILEAMARGLPVIATDRGGIPEIISNGETGLLVPADEPETLADAINRLLVNDELVQRLRFSALHMIREEYVLEKIVDQTLEYLRHVLAS